MFQIDPLGLIPDNLKNAALNGAVDIISDLAKKLLGDEFADKFKLLRSDAAFRKSFQQGLEKAVQRFTAEYAEQDEDLVRDITQSGNFFQNEQVQKSLLAMIKNPGSSLADEREILLQSFETVFPSRLNRQRVDRAISYLLKFIVEEVWNLPELQPVYSLQFQRITAEASLQMIALQKANLRAVETLDSGLRDLLLQLVDTLAEKKQLPSPQAPDAPPQSKVIHNLPALLSGKFVGREKEIGQIYQELLPYPYSQHSVITIDGIGGVGKTTLVLEIANRYILNYEKIPIQVRFDAIIWFNAKETILKDHIIQIDQVERTLSEIYTKIAYVLNNQAIIYASTKEQPELVRQALTNQRTLLIVDNLESIEDEQVISFLTQLPAPTKAIVTTRCRIDIAVPVRLTGMEWVEAQKLIRNECKVRNLSIEPWEELKLFERTGGVPLAMVWSISQIDYGYEVEQVLKSLSNPQGDLARFCFETSMQMIAGQPAELILYTLSLFAIDAPLDILVTVTELTVFDLQHHFTSLIKLSLANKVKQRYEILPLTKSYLRERLKNKPEFEERLFIRLADAYIEWSIEKDQNVAGDSIRSFKDWRAERSNVLAVIEEAYARGKYDLFLKLILTASYFQFTLGYWEERTHYAQMGTKIARTINDINSFARLGHDIAYMAYTQGNFEEAEFWSKQSQQAFRSLTNDPWHLGSSLRLSAMIALERNEIDQAEQDLQEALLIMEGPFGTITGKSVALNGLARVAIRRGDLQKAQELIEQSISLGKEKEHHDSLSHCYRVAGEIAELQGDLQRAEYLYLYSLGFDEDMDRPPMQAQSLVRLASLALRSDKTDEAIQYAQRAKDIAETVRMKIEIQRSIEILEKAAKQKQLKADL